MELSTVLAIEPVKRITGMLKPFASQSITAAAAAALVGSLAHSRISRFDSNP